MSYMLDEIHQQPEVLKRVVAEESKNVAALAAEIKKRNINFGMLAARGTSDNAATYGKYLFEIMNGMPIGLAAPSIFTLYKAAPKLENTLVVGISQSGKAADVIEYLQGAKRQGALTVGITNEAGSEMTKVADYTILCHAGPERSVAATKTYTSTLAGLYLLNSALAGHEDGGDKLIKVADQISEIMKSLEGEIAQRAERYRYMDTCIVLARGVNRATAFEGGLKMAETCYVNSQPYSSVDFIHGPIAIVKEGAPCFLYAPGGAAFDSMMDMANRLGTKGAEMIVISHNQEILSKATTPFRVPVDVDEMLSPIAYIIVGQIFAQYLSRTKGVDPDNPRGLSKVTITR